MIFLFIYLGRIIYTLGTRQVCKDVGDKFYIFGKD